jgi:hypothetical protein
MPELKKAAKQFIVGIGLLSSGLTINNTFTKPESEIEKQKREAAAAQIKKAEETAKEATDARTANNLTNKMHIEVIQIAKNSVDRFEVQESELQKALKENRVK